MPKPDILLYLGRGENEELRYAVRTWEKNLNFGKLYAVGGPKPMWFHPDIYVENPLKYQKMRQCYDNLRIALNDDRLTEDVILMMDDIFILQYWGDWTINHNRGDLWDQYLTLNKAFGKNNYNEMLRHTHTTIVKDISSPLSFEEHAPFLCNRKKLWAILEQYGARKMDNMLYRSIYGNIYHIPTEYRKDVKFTKIADRLSPTDNIVSTNENAFRGTVGETIKNRFPKPSRFEG